MRRLLPTVTWPDESVVLEVTALVRLVHCNRHGSWANAAMKPEAVREGVEVAQAPQWCSETVAPILLFETSYLNVFAASQCDHLEQLSHLMRQCELFDLLC
jgi:hypothetical protein